MNRLKSIIFGRRFRHGGNAVIMTAGLIAVLVFINLIIGQFNLAWDMTQEKMYSLSEETKDILENRLEKDIRIIGLYQQGQKIGDLMDIVQESLKSFDEVARVEVEFIDPIKEAGFIKRYEKSNFEIKEGSVIVEIKDDRDRYLVLDPNQLVSYNAQTRNYDSLQVEQQVVSAIMNITSDVQPKIYVLKGHGEPDIAQLGIKQEMINENYLVEDLNLFVADGVPEDADIVLVIAPQKDISEEEADRFVDYLVNGGRALFLFNVVIDEDLLNFKEVLEGIGIKLNDDVVVEGDRQGHTGNSLVIVPRKGTHEITSTLDDILVVLPINRSIEILEQRKSSIDIDTLLVTSQNSWGKLDLDNDTMEKEEGDLQGPLTLAAAIQDKLNRQDVRDMKAVVVGNAAFINDLRLGNRDFFLNSLNWLVDRENNTTIRAKDLNIKMLEINYNQMIINSIIVILVIPLTIFIACLIIWLRRRHL